MSRLQNVKRIPFLFFVVWVTSALAVTSPSDSQRHEDRVFPYSPEWHIHFVDTGDIVGEFASIDLDTLDYPHIAYHDSMENSVKYASWNGTTWVIETVDSGIGGYHVSLVLDSNDDPHVSYRDTYVSDLRYARWDGIDWNVEVVDSNGEVGDSSLAVDSNDYPHISYHDHKSHDLKYAQWNGSAWHFQTADATVGVGTFTSIAIDSQDNPHISYYDFKNGDLKYARWNGSAWMIKTVDQKGHVGVYTSIALDSQDHPHISYADYTNEKLKYARWTGSIWIVETVEPAGKAGLEPSIAIDSSDRPHISYFNGTTGRLGYARWNGVAWEIEIADPAHDVGRYSSLALDSNDSPHIGYHDDANESLKYATKADLGPPPPPVLSFFPVAIDFGTLPTDILATETFDIWNSGNGMLEYYINTSMPLVKAVDPFTGNSTGERDIISVTIDTTGYPEGLHIGTLWISSDGGNGSIGLSAHILEPSRSLSLNIDPDTLNLKSRGRWVTAYLSAENASVHDIDVSTILLQNALAPERWDYQDDVLMLKFNRQEFKKIVVVGESIEMNMTGKWEDGTAFEAYDFIRVINPGK